MKFKIISYKPNKPEYTVEAYEEQDAWEYFLDNLLPIEDEVDDWTIQELKKLGK